ncbi:LacI family DNA-binding transcriptional regulator [Gilvimarinus sp. SDUM040013]|uniref:LacI family DNA-binding transcriptional regulator n=1 Tax=Gilvimarinus gilvus TaxID=3058038 RepID=A0ABU4RT76_9GAMM|nr:LacI family DNA-binding transcriptional regulator [Gilvimarinus sp. SDUM040013]MDO3387022.1 LacI family DNA-binding transcriptional regulator [Gilvimarinus sp. SDUM040013]MDX6848084.1 LacI family DNA-binding transcriptional regulator [Gilvimarinus sp. SDUM040013]
MVAKATIDDVAALAGVSMKTVSRVVNNEPNVRAATREKVAAAIAALDYRPSQSARSLAANRSYVLGLLYDNPSASYVIDVQAGALATCRRAGYDLLIHPCKHDSEELTQEVLLLARQSRVDGLILTPPLSDIAELVQGLVEAQVPFVRLSPTENKAACPYVQTNDQEAAYDMTCKLLELGHTRIGFIAGHPDHKAVTERYLGYLAALKENDLRYDRTLVEQGYNSFDSGRECAARLLDLPDAPTAIFASNDDMAAGVIIEAHHRGIAMPVELSVAGFDDTPVAHQIFPSLTTVRQPIVEMAGKAAELLIKLLKGKSVQMPAAIMSCRILERESTHQVQP